MKLRQAPISLHLELCVSRHRYAAIRKSLGACLERKSIENLEAARLLMAEDDPCPNAAASRAYYAAYQACWALLVAEGHRPEKSPRGTYFPHTTLPEIAVSKGVITEEEGDRLEFLESQRVVADYFEEQVSAKIGHQCVADAETLVSLLGETS